MNVPQLRFPEFEGAWENARFDHWFKINAGGDVPADGTSKEKTEEFKFPIFANSAQRRGLYGYAKNYREEGGCVTVSGRGELGLPNARHEPFVPIVRLLVLRPKCPSDVDFFENAILQTRIFVESTGVPQLTGPQLSSYHIAAPTLPEQKKIAAFLGVVDAKIAALRARRDGLERYKRGLMQALFSQTLRFSKPDGTAFPDWEEKRLGEVATRSTSKNTKLEHMRVLTNSAVQGVVDQGAYFDKDIANAENLAGYYVLKKGDFVYNPRISSSAPVGPIKRNDLGDGVMSPLYTVFRFKQRNTTFYNVYFATTFWHKYMKSVANYGARHDRMAITASDLMNMPLPHPHPDEQQKIADALSVMDAKIAAVADQATQMETFKKGLLQQMFV